MFPTVRARSTARAQLTIHRTWRAAVVAVALLALSAPPALAQNERDSTFFADSGLVCIEGVDATTAILGGLQFQSATRSLAIDCQTDRPLPSSYISTATGIRAIDGTTGSHLSCGYYAIGLNADGSARADAPYVQATGAQIRAMCGIPAGHFAAAGAFSRHDAVIWGSWTQEGHVVGTVSNVI